MSSHAIRSRGEEKNILIGYWIYFVSSLSTYAHYLFMWLISKNLFINCTRYTFELIIFILYFPHWMWDLFHRMNIHFITFCKGYRVKEKEVDVRFIGTSKVKDYWVESSFKLSRS